MVVREIPKDFASDLVEGMRLGLTHYINRTYAKIAKKLNLLNRQDAKNAKNS